ncbi:MAG: hypothetical protein J3K34DRAFT_258671 [Monoraphidium minutum]|nr:MAG: hypothetical protein J3K34DRAFT_258671 [Monoraphidium minutum]
MNPINTRPPALRVPRVVCGAPWFRGGGQRVQPGPRPRAALFFRAPPPRRSPLRAQTQPEASPAGRRRGARAAAARLGRPVNIARAPHGAARQRSLPLGRRPLGFAFDTARAPCAQAPRPLPGPACSDLNTTPHPPPGAACAPPLPAAGGARALAPPAWAAWERSTFR